MAFRPVCVAAIICAGVLGARARAFDISPGHIRIGAFYRGATVRVSARLPGCDGAVVILEGRDETVTLNRKGRVAGIWLNVARITFDSLPNVYILAASGELDRICSGAAREKHRLGLESLRNRMTVSGSAALSGTEFDEFLKFKTRYGAYNTGTRFKMPAAAGERGAISACLPVSPEIPPGIYQVRLYGFKAGALVKTEAARFEITRAGLPELMHTLAYKHPAAHGLMAVAVAMVVGIVMGFIFSSLPGRRR